MSLAEKIKHDEEAARKEGIAQGRDGWVKLQEGENRFRVLSEPEMIFEDFKLGICYTDCGFEGAAKFLMYVLDRKDNKIKLWKAPYSVGTAIAGYETDEDYQFDGYPMPYDIKLNAKGAGTKEVKYTLIPGRATVAVGTEIMSEFGKKKPATEVIQAMKEKNKEKHIADGTYETRQQERAKIRQEIADLHGGASGTTTDGVQYPDEVINPEDIPF